MIESKGWGEEGKKKEKREGLKRKQKYWEVRTSAERWWRGKEVEDSGTAARLLA